MEPVDLVPSGYRFLPTAAELVVDYLANWVAGATLPGRAVAFADVYGTEPWNLLGSDRHEGYFFAERKPKNNGGSRVDRNAGSGSWTLYKKQEPVKSIVGGREMVVGRKSCLSFNDGRRKNSGWTMYEYQMCSSGFERRVLCHVKRSSHQAISGGTTIKTVESTFTEAATDTVTGDSFVGRKRNREESSTLSAKASTLSKKPCWGLVAHSSTALLIDASPPPTAVVQFPLLAAVTPPESHHSSVDSVAPNEAGVPAASPSSTDVGGEVVITAEDLEAFLASYSSSVDQNCTDDAFITRDVEAFVVSPPPTAVVQHPPPESHLSSVVSVAPNEAGVPAASPSSTPVISAEEFEAFLASSWVDQNCTREVEAILISDDTDTASTTIPKASPSGLVDLLLMPDDTRIDSTTVAEVPSSASSIDLVAYEQIYSTDFFTSLEHVHDFLMSDDTFTFTASTTIPVASLGQCSLDNPY
ncbi:NAC transcription factor NAM-B2-like [Musa acuminata AAA Group]|uniref:NAC transcription factor NAM-B2-like n=1 Tax=Musa acuminata AAA Group TaxID=214697 RepID=UPI0031D3B4F8